MAVGDAYKASGVDYNALDEFKRFAQGSAASTAHHLETLGLHEVAESRGESVYLVELPDRYLAFVEEGLGTKNLVADAMEQLTGKTYYDAIAQDTVAAIVNDLITLGAQPMVVAMHCAAGSSQWMDNTARWKALVNGWKAACDIAGATWGPGETPALKGIVQESTVVLSGSCIGQIASKHHRIMGNVQDGDAIVLVESSGIHANGLSLARSIIEARPDGYQTRLPDGRMIGEALLTPTIIYAPLMRSILKEGIVPHYSVNITGHGWRKLMRLPEPFVYRITVTPPVPVELTALQQWQGLSDEEMYATFTMGAGFALYMTQEEADRVLTIANDNGLRAWRAGIVEKEGNEKRVIIEPKNITYQGESLQVR